MSKGGVAMVVTVNARTDITYSLVIYIYIYIYTCIVRVRIHCAYVCYSM